MDVKVISRDERKVVLEIYGEDHTLGNMLMKEALRHPAVEYAAYRIAHPLKNVVEFVLVVKEGSDMSVVFKEVIERLKEEIRGFRQAFERALAGE